MTQLTTLIRTSTAVLVIDQITKLVVVHALDLKNSGVMLIADPYLKFRMAWNEGINFGIPLANRWVLIALAAAICIWIIIWMMRERPGKAVQISAGLVLAAQSCLLRHLSYVFNCQSTCLSTVE